MPREKRKIFTFENCLPVDNCNFRVSLVLRRLCDFYSETCLQNISCNESLNLRVLFPWRVIPSAKMS